MQHLEEDELIVELVQVSVGPYMRARMKANAPKGYFSPFVIGQPISGGTVVMSWLEALFGRRSNASRLAHLTLSVVIDTSIPVLGTAYNGFLEICQPKEGELVLVSAASCAVGSLIGQISKIKGCKVIGISGSEENEQLKDLGFDAVINYKNFNDTKFNLGPNSLRSENDNVGGFVLDAATLAMNRGGRISLSVILVNMDQPYWLFTFHITSSIEPMQARCDNGYEVECVEWSPD